MQKITLKKRIAIGMLVLVMSICLVACGGDGGQNVAEGNGEMPSQLSVFAYVSTNTTKAGGTSRGDVMQYKLAEEATGCKINWKNVDEAAVKEQFNLMITSGDYPDIINYSWSSVDGGAGKYIDDGVIVPISDYLDYMPNFKKFMEEHPEIAAQYTDEKGRIAWVPCVRADEELQIFVGPTIRQDWLDKLGLKMPTNNDELYTVLKAFKEQDPNGNGKKDEIPVTGIGGNEWAFGIGNIVQGFDTYYGLYIKDGKVTHGMIEPEMKEALAYLSKLYQEGLIDPDYLTQDLDTFRGKVMNDRAGYFHDTQPSRYYQTMNDGTKLLAGVPYFNGRSYNQQYKISNAGHGAAISASCTNPAGAARWLDYFFSEEGIIAANYGVEGKTYNVVDGNKVLNMDFFDNNPDGLERTVALSMNIEVTNTNFAGVQLWDAYKQTLAPWGVEAINAWSKDTDLSGAIPSVVLTAAEKKELGSKETDVNTYVGSLFNAIIIGNKPLSELDKAPKELEKLGLNDVLTIYNNAYKRFTGN